MRADRLVSLVLLLRQRGRMTADQLASELEVSTRTVLRDIDALSTAGVPVYADRGRHGGFSLLPGFRTELTGLNHDEALALLTAGSDRGEKVFGLSAPLAAAMRKVVDALPEGHRASVNGAAKRFLVEPETDLLSRRPISEELAEGVMGEVRGAVLTGHRLRFDYAAPGKVPSSHAVDPIGLVTVRGRTYLLATKSGDDRTYRLSRILRAEELSDPAQRPTQVDLDRIWAERSARFLSEGHIPVTVGVRRSRRDELLNTARAVRAEEPAADGWVRLEVTFEDLRHAVWAIWQLGTDAEVLAPDAARKAMYERAQALADRYRP
ncbi:helix-turn-helix transcriptional regulator [Nocardia vermiculata]|uniref:WYL domain-containing protein n=1 Tax=Nocardia vermiculata TaxID=257274 RepID=A0A846XW75_9NOCA|nr:WYL domain-containing protein [Nocardia vermiculata]NKY51386.1 WYL domain-containing protein [Nocardia vermiculata]